MFGHIDSVIGLWPGERPDEMGDDTVDLAYELTCRELADGWIDDDRQVLPADLEDMIPGPFLAAVVSSVDPGRMNGHDVVRLMKARARLSSHHEAGKFEAISEVAFAPPSDVESGVLRSSEQVDYASLEVATALALTRRSSESQLDLAVSLTGTLRLGWEAFSSGDLDLPRVRVFDKQLGHLPDETVEIVLGEILEEAGSLTTGQLRARLAKLVLEADPDGSKSSYEEGRRDRTVAVTANPDHTANYQIFSGAPEDVTAARDYVERLARSLKTKNEPRTLEQLRNDVSLDLLQGKHPEGCLACRRPDEHRGRCRDPRRAIRRSR